MLTKVLLIVMIKLNIVLLYFLVWAKGVRTSKAFHHEDEFEIHHVDKSMMFIDVIRKPS